VKLERINSALADRLPDEWLRGVYKDTYSRHERGQARMMFAAAPSDTLRGLGS